MADLSGIKTILSRERMKWLGHVYRVENMSIGWSIPKQCLFGGLFSGFRPHGRPKVRYRGVCKDTMNHLQIGPKSWEQMASDRATRMDNCGACAQEQASKKRS